MHDGNDENFVHANLINDTVRKTMCDAAACSGGKAMPCNGIGQDALEGLLDGIGKFVAEARTFSVITVDGLSKFCACD